MEVILAKSAGFCFGVKRAVALLEQTLASEQPPIYTYGPIIHNAQVVQSFQDRGVLHMEEGSDPSTYSPGTVVIRSHGVARQVILDIKAAGHRIIDATCPFVSKIQKLVETHTQQGIQVILLGDGTHPEVQGILGYACPRDLVHVCNDTEQIAEMQLDSSKLIVVAAQTTFNYKKFQECIEILKENNYNIKALNTICNATEERQIEASQIAGEVDVMFVIGDKHSSNSRKLYEICRERCVGTKFIQTKEDVDLSVLSSTETVGITAGASTPVNIIEEVTKKCRK